jgi:hypothetical protein
MIVMVGDLVRSEIGIIRIAVIVDIQNGLEGIIRMAAFDDIVNSTLISRAQRAVWKALNSIPFLV